MILSTDKDMLTSYLAPFKVGDGSTITTECFNASDTHKFNKRFPCHSSSTFEDEACSKKNSMKLPSVR